MAQEQLVEQSSQTRVLTSGTSSQGREQVSSEHCRSERPLCSDRKPGG